jgi:methionine-rich copper-binding protein CopC
MRRLILATVLLLVVGGCSVETAAGAHYVLRESAVDGPNRLSASGEETFSVENTGEYSHTLVITDDTGQVIAATGLVESGEQTSLRVDLEPGKYVFSCRIVSQDGEGNLIDHFELGMHRTVSVGS